MLDVWAAREIVLRHAKPLPPKRDAWPVVGRVLAEDVASDIDSPPFDKSMMDGYAIRSADGDAVRVVNQEIPAGVMPTQPVGPGEAARIFTGAPMPAGADTVVMQEKAEPQSDGRVKLNDPGMKPGQHVLKRGREMRAGEVVLPKGTVLTPAAVGLLAAVGRSRAPVLGPHVSVLATGDELVEADQVPGPGQIRNTNGPMLAALAVQARANTRTLGIARDTEESLRTLIRDGLDSADVLLLSGGVSVGKLDLVPTVLAEFGLTSHFHQVRMKPGKPLLFGTVGEKLVFGLPGNPVSSYVGFHLFVKPALRKLAGHPDAGPGTETRTLSEPFAASNNRPTFHPAKLEPGGRVRGLPWFGSPDLRALLHSDALLVLPPGDVDYPAGAAVEVIET